MTDYSQARPTTECDWCPDNEAEFFELEINDPDVGVPEKVQLCRECHGNYVRMTTDVRPEQDTAIDSLPA